MDPMQWRWYFELDANRDGVFSISDIWLNIKWICLAPGDAIIYWLAKIPDLRTFFELSEASYGNWFSILIGLPIFFVGGFMALLVLGMLLESMLKALK